MSGLKQNKEDPEPGCALESGGIRMPPGWDLGTMPAFPQKSFHTF